MPCYEPRDYDSTPVDVKVNGLTAKQLNALLCGVLDFYQSHYNDAILWNKVDWEECGLHMSDALMWHQRHKIADEQRRQRERDEANRKKLIADGLKKLTYQERIALGIKLKGQ